MTPLRHHRRLTLGLAAAVVTAGVPSLATAAGPSTGDEESVVTVVDAGDPSHQVVLPGTVPEGATADVTTNYDVEMAMSGSGLPITIDVDAVGDMARTTEVIAVQATGNYTTRETITSYELTVTEGKDSDLGDLGMDDAPTTDYGPIVDVPLLVEYEPTGIIASLQAEDPTTMTPEQEELIVDLAEEGFGIEGFGEMFPTTPVGEGAVWTVTGADNPAGMGFPLALRFEVVSLDGNDYTVELSIDGDIADYLESQAASEGAEVSGDMTLTGTFTGDAANALDQDMTLDMTMDMSVSEDGLSADVVAAIGIDHASTPR